MSPPSLGPAPDLASGRSWWRSVGVWRLQGECPVRALALKWSSADKLVDAIGRSDHSVLYHLQPSSADRKSTRLNSSHVASSYAVFCLQQKNEELAFQLKDADVDDLHTVMPFLDKA